MKVYVVAYRRRKDDEQSVGPLRRDNTDVWFSAKRGDWLLPHQEYAQREIDLLTSWRVHVNEHYCQFELEEESGTFAIVCRDHPPLAQSAEA